MDFTKRTSSYRNCVKEILLLATLAPLGAQPSARTVEGVVLDQHSHPVAHAAVQIENEWTLQVRSWITQADGRYHFAGLNGDGDYQITAEYDGLSATCESRVSSIHDSRILTLNAQRIPAASAAKDPNGESEKRKRQ